MNPTVSIILPVYNEAQHIETCLADLAAQDYPGIVEILVADGGSTDATRHLVETAGDGRARLFDNPLRLQSHGLNHLLRHRSGEVVVRVDAHTRYAADYVGSCVRVLGETGAWVVGGPQIAQTPDEAFGVGVARAMAERWAGGPAAFRSSDRSGEVDTVYLGAYPSWVFDRVGGYRSFPSGVAEDVDLCHRIRRAGGVVWLDPSIRSLYLPRSTVGALWRQYLRYGRGKAEMARFERRLPGLRPLAPAGLVAALALGAVLLAWSPYPVVALLVGWLGMITALSLRHGRWAPMVGVAAMVMHLSYGLGFWASLLSPLGPAPEPPDVRSVIPPTNPA